MQTQIVCECGNEIAVPAEQANAEYRCPRCGRRVFVNEEEAKVYFDSHHGGRDNVPIDDGIRPPAVIRQDSQSHPTSPTSDISAAIQRNAQRSAEHHANDPDATVIQSSPQHALAPEQGKMYSEADAPTLPTNNNDFEVKQQPADDDSSVAGSSSSTQKYDLSQRVMRPIAKPVLPTIPYTGTGEYGIHRILRVHQKGGMGRILVAYDQYLKRDVAIKELHPEVADDDSIVRRFIGEAEITAQLEHPGVIPIHRLGQGHDGLPYYTMKMIKGETLQEAIKAYHRKPSRSELLNLVRRLVSVAKTIAFAHSKGVIHRDLKPANVMLGEHGETLVMDWGLAKPFNQGIEESYVSIVHRTKQPRPELTMVGAIVGTPAFMSPEQAQAEESMIGPLSDVFSLGTVLYYLLAGQTAFSGRSTQDVLNKVRACNPMPPSQIKSTVPHDLEIICLKAMAKSPEDRYQGASEFADDLCRWLDDEPISAAKDTIFTKIRRWLHRHRSLAMDVICVMLLSLILTGIGVGLVSRYADTATGDAVTQGEIEFKTNVRIEASPGVRVWLGHRLTGALTLVCRVKATESEKQHRVSIHAPAHAWDLSKRDFLEFSLLEIDSESGASLKNFSVRLGQGESHDTYKPGERFWESRKRTEETPWTITIPLWERHEDWERQTVGTPTMAAVEWVEIHFDTDADMVLILDHLQFE